MYSFRLRSKYLRGKIEANFQSDQAQVEYAKHSFSGLESSMKSPQNLISNASK